MADYAVGDIQGCSEPLGRLLEHIDFKLGEDRLWCVGDLVGRGSDSLGVLRFLKNLKPAPRITLGNHDLALLHFYFLGMAERIPLSARLSELLAAEDCDELLHWLRQQALLIYEPAFNVVMTHAGLPPEWDLETAMAAARAVEHALAGEQYQDCLAQMWGNDPSSWRDCENTAMRWRYTVNALTRMRFCSPSGKLLLDYKGDITASPTGYIPWFMHPDRKALSQKLLFGHWAAINGQTGVPGIYALDTGCHWGNGLTALRLQDFQLFFVPAKPS